MAAQRHDAALSRAVAERNEQARALFVESPELVRFMDDMLGDSDRAEVRGKGSLGLREMVLLARIRSVATFDEGRLSRRYGFVPSGLLTQDVWSTFEAGELVRKPPPLPAPTVVSRLEPPRPRKPERLARSKVR